ncbi:MAG: chondroitinase-B domain-containing protein, partial [Byssovorax sp.]
MSPRFHLPRMLPALACSTALSVAAISAYADDTLHPGTPQLDPPTLVALGVELPITGDDNFNATVTLRYRRTGTSAWHDGLPLQHVHAEVVTGFSVQPQFAGSIFDLAPDTTYDIELHAVDPDGAVDATRMLTGHTRAVPAKEPAHPHAVAVTDHASLQSALDAAKPGDVITLANGTYAGVVSFGASGTAADPIVIRGQSEDGVVLDGMACTGCNIVEAYGSFLHIESLTIQNGERGIRYQTSGAQENVVRRVHLRDVTLGIGLKADQQNFYIADNVLEGRLEWPCVYTSDDVACNGDAANNVQHGRHANDDGINVQGNGHVVAHNVLSGFGDAMKTEQDGAISVDFYGNDVLWSYDNGIELDGSARNTRALRNRFTNTFATLSFQPIFGGPSYAIRNVLVNVTDEQFKLHSRGADPTVGAVIYHTTVVRSTRAIQCSTAASPLDFTVENNLFIGPSALDADMHAVRWDVPLVKTGLLDYNGFYPDGIYEYGYDNANGGFTAPSFAALAAAGPWEKHSALVGAASLAGGIVGAVDWHALLLPIVPGLASGSSAIDRGTVLPNIDDGYLGAAPDLGALEAGCALPLYGVRPLGMDEVNEPLGCVPGSGSGSGSGSGGG